MDARQRLGWPQLHLVQRRLPGLVQQQTSSAAVLILMPYTAVKQETGFGDALN